jgi:hypothetical protein
MEVIHNTNDIILTRWDNTNVVKNQGVEDCLYNPGFENYKGCKKIILTTDGDLIKDGIQVIDDDEFLEWFVKNPSCERVEVSEDCFKPSNMVYGINMEPYKIIIPSIGINSLNKQD